MIDKYNKENHPIIFLCKYLFEINLITRHLGEENCIILSGTKNEERKEAVSQFEKQEKKYLISTTTMLLPKLDNLNDKVVVIFFSLSFKYQEYQRCITYLENNLKESLVSVMCFFTNSGIDHRIKESLDLKNDLSSEIKSMFRDKTGIKQFIESL